VLCSIMYYTKRKEAPMDMSAIEQRQRDIMREMEQIRVMKKGSVTFQRYPARGRGQDAGRERGPYPVLTWKEQGCTKSMRLKSAAQVAWAEKAVENHRRFTELRCEYERLGEERALHGREEMASASQEAQKKGLKSPRKPRPK